MHLKRLLPALAFGAALTLSGCSSLSSGEQDETLTFTSLPSNADILVVDVTNLEGKVDIRQHGEPIFLGKTPVTMELPGTTENGKLLREYVVAIEKAGYARHETRLEAVGSEARLRPQDGPSNDQTLFLGWQLIDPQSREVSHLPYNQVDVELDDLNN